MSAVACPYCRSPLEDGEAVVCEGCATPHHADCLEENGGCTVFGCVKAPPAEPKLSIGLHDLAGDSAPAVSPMAVRVAPPPPPPPVQSPSHEIAVPVLFSSTGYHSPVPRPAVYTAPPVYQPAIDFNLLPHPEARSRTAFTLLGIFLGSFGAHSFYAGYTRKAVIQLLLTIFTLGMAGLMIWIWAIVDVCTTARDSRGIPFRS
ncbi:MAG: NINE protein [Acidobacteriota bacterium]